jgi:cellulose synthase (UDP-forming)
VSGAATTDGERFDLLAPVIGGVVNVPPDDEELWSYTVGDGRMFLRFSALSRLSLGIALVFLSTRGEWLLLLFPFAVMVVISAAISLVWSTQVRPFDRDSHLDRIGRGSLRDVPVDVFITTCGEDPAVIDNTVWRAVSLRHPGGVHVYVLDDKGSPDIRAIAALWGATYLHRPNPGWMKKAGNLQFGYANSSSPLIVVLDADFALRDDFLEHTIGYFDDESIGILQTPQFFRVSKTNWVERGAASQQEQFYRIGMRARDRHHGAICVGTNAVYRRSALDTRGGMALLEHSEDLFTGMKVIDAGYQVMYLPLPLAAGSAPTTTAALASQQYRWARGNFALAGTPLFKRLRLTPMQRLSIWDGWFYYITSAFSPVVAVVVPLLTLAEAPHAISLAPTAMVLPSLFTEFVLQPRWLYLSDGPASRRVGLISQLSHLYALRDHLSDREQEWVPTGGRDAPKHAQATDRIPGIIAAGALCGFVATLVMVGVRSADGYSLIDLAPVIVLALIALPTALAVTMPAERVQRATKVDESRDVFLDTVRAISIVRVLFWHALGFWWISWTFSAMPAVFYVSGAVLAKSLRRRPVRQVIASRLRRLLPPYLVFIGTGLVAVTIADPSGLRHRWLDALSWVVPYRNPAPLPWEEGWLSSPLWFLRALILVLVLTIPARHVARLLPATAWLVLWVGALITADVVVNRQTTQMSTAIVRGLGDIVTFGGFFAAGIAVHHRRHAFGTRERLSALIALIALTVVITWAAPPPDMVVNNSNVFTALVGLCWLVGLLLVEQPLRDLASIPAMGRLVSWVSGGSMSVYLWHTLVICVCFYLVGQPDSPGGYLILGLVFLSLLLVVVRLARPFESLGTPGRDRLRRAPLAIAAVGILLLTMQPTLFPKIGNQVVLPAPSGRPAVGGAAAPAGPAAPSARPAVGAQTSTAELAAAATDSTVDAEAWLRGHDVESAVVVSISGARDGPVTLRLGARSMHDDDPFEILSGTKTMVAAAALQLVDEGAIDLDAPLPTVEGIPARVTSTLTMRRLLAHATGLIDYRETPGWRADAILTPTDAVMLSVAASDVGKTDVNYAASNYMLAGLVMEQVTGEPLGQILQERLFDPLGMTDTKMVDNSRDGFVGYASGGVVSTMHDLAIWYNALTRERTVLGPEMLDQMMWGGSAFSKGGGLGAWRHCPCVPATPEVPEPFLYLFHDGGDVRLIYIPSRDIVMVMRFSTSLYGPTKIVGDIDDFIFAALDDSAGAILGQRVI